MTKKQQTTLFDSEEIVAPAKPADVPTPVIAKVTAKPKKAAQIKTDVAEVKKTEQKTAAKSAPLPVEATPAPAKVEVSVKAFMTKKTEPKAVPAPAPINQQPKPAKTMNEVYKALTGGLQKYFLQHNFKRAVLGLSGGVDSALTLKIAVDALGAENVTAILMPELGLTKEENIEHSKAICEFLGATYFYQPINSFVSDFNTCPWKPPVMAQMNTKARIRSVLLYNYANTEHALVLGTSNKSELLLGYGTKFGDLAADIEVIGDLYKTEVIKLADFIGLPPEIVNKVPSAELAPGQTDEGELGATYNELDKILMKLDFGQKHCIEHGLPIALVQRVFRRVAENKHKTELPFLIKIR